MTSPKQEEDHLLNHMAPIRKSTTTSKSQVVEPEPGEEDDDNLQNLLQADKNMDQVFLQMVDRLNYYLSRAEELRVSIESLEEQVAKQSNNAYVKARLQAQKKQKKNVDFQIMILEKQSQAMMVEQSKFKKKRDQLLENYYAKKGEEEEEEEQKEIDEEMKIIDQKLEEIEQFNKRNFKIDEDFLSLFSDIYDQYDQDIVTAPYQEYTEANPPPYFPQHGVWQNAQEEILYTPQSPGPMTEEEMQELKELEDESENNQRSSTKMKRNEGNAQKKENRTSQFFGFFKKKQE